MLELEDELRAVLRERAIEHLLPVCDFLVRRRIALDVGVRLTQHVRDQVSAPSGVRDFTIDNDAVAYAGMTA